MDTKKIFKTVMGIIIAWLVICAIIIGGLIWVAIHFIGKLW